MKHRIGDQIAHLSELLGWLYLHAYLDHGFRLMTNMYPGPRHMTFVTGRQCNIRISPQNTLLDCLRTIEREDYVGTRRSRSGTLREYTPIERTASEEWIGRSNEELSTSAMTQ